MVIGPRSWLRLGRRETPVPPIEDFRFKFPLSVERPNYLQHFRGADIVEAIGSRGFLTVPDKETVIIILDRSESMSDPALSDIDPPISQVLETMVIDDLIPALQAQGRQGFILDMPGQPVASVGEAWLHLFGRVGEFIEFNNFFCGDILFITFSNGAESLPGQVPEGYYVTNTVQDPYAGPTDTYWEQYSWIAPDFGGGGPFTPYNNAVNYRSLGALMFSLPVFSTLGGPPFTWGSTYGTHLDQAISGTGFHVNFPLNRPEVSQLVFYGGEIVHTEPASFFLPAIDFHFDNI